MSLLHKLGIRLTQTVVAMSLLVIAPELRAQFYYGTYGTPTPFNNYYYDLKVANPAFIGSKGEHVINTLYSGESITSGFDDYSARKLYASYEANIEKYNTGLGALAFFDKFGIHAYRDLSVFYRRSFAIGNNIGINVGAQLQHQVLTRDYSALNPRDPNDPIIVANEKRKAANLAIGVLLKTKYFDLGISGRNLLNDEFGRRLVTFIAQHEFFISESFQTTPSVFHATDFSNDRLSINNILRIKKWILIGGGYSLYNFRDKDLVASAGLDIKGWVQIMTHLYSNAAQKLDDYREPFFETMVQVRIPGGFPQKRQ